MNKSCHNCTWKSRYTSSPHCSYYHLEQYTICDKYKPACHGCGHLTDYIYQDKYFCYDCLLKYLEVDSCVITHYRWQGEYLGSDNDIDEVIDILNENLDYEIKEIKDEKPLIREDK